MNARSKKWGDEAVEKHVSCDVLVIGGGIGGFCAAITAKENGMEIEVVLVEKSYASRTGPSALVGGVFSGILQGDDIEQLLKKTVELNGFLVDQDAISHVMSNGPNTVANLEKWGVNFVRDDAGDYVRVYQRSTHGTLLLEDGGLVMMQALRKYALKLGVKIIDWVTVTDLLTREGSVVGAVGIHAREETFLILQSKVTVLATGGTIFKTRQPGHRQVTGDGWAMAYRAGAEIAGMDLSTPNIYGANLEVGPGNGLYLSQGARLLNNKMEEYIKNYPELEQQRNPSAHVYPIVMEKRRGNAPPIWLDLTQFTPEQVEMVYRSVPYAARRWEKLGFIHDRKFVKLCEYAPEGPRPEGGICVDPVTFESRNLEALFGCGEAVTSLQCGRNLSRAASSGIIAGQFASKKAAITTSKDPVPEQVAELQRVATTPLARKEGFEPEYVLTMIQDTLHPEFVHIFRTAKHLQGALSEMETIRSELIPNLRAYDPHYLRLAHDLRNLALCGEMFLRSAILREESRNGALREDFPEQDNLNWLKWVIVAKSESGMQVKTEEIPIEQYKVQPRRSKVVHKFWARCEELGYWQRPEEE